jgi:hypothetical protein
MGVVRIVNHTPLSEVCDSNVINQGADIITEDYLKE